MITALTRGSLDSCASLYADTFNAPPWNESWSVRDAAQRLEDAFATPRSFGVCTSSPDGDVLGFALGHLERSGADDHFLLQELCVRTSVQRQGYGTELLEALADRLDQALNWYLLTARDSDAAAFYEKNGFRPAGRMGVFVRP